MKASPYLVRILVEGNEYTLLKVSVPFVNFYPILRKIQKKSEYQKTQIF